VTLPHSVAEFPETLTSFTVATSRIEGVGPLVLKISTQRGHANDRIVSGAQKHGAFREGAWEKLNIPLVVSANMLL